MHILGRRHIYNKAVGSIIGGIFFLLILIMGYTLFTLGNQAVKSQEQTISNMREFDIERGQENLALGNPYLTGGILTIQVQNNGPRTSTIKNIGIWDGTSWTYTNIDVMLNSGDIKPIGVLGIPAMPSYSIQLITERGIIYNKNYP